MSKVIADISMSLDGFVTGPDPDLQHGLGHGGEALHDWALHSDEDVDERVLREMTESTGAVVMGRRLFDFVDGPHGWSDDMGYGASFAATPPFHVVTHTVPEQIRLDLDFTFITTGLPNAIEQDRAAAEPKDVFVMGGADVIGQCLDTGLLHELRIHLAPLVLGSGIPLLRDRAPSRLVQRSVRVSSTATHLIYEPS